jgi:hypothetical protein
VHIDEVCFRIVGIAEDPYVVENGGIMLIADKLDFLFDEEESFQWFMKNVEDGYTVMLSRPEDSFINLDDLFDVDAIADVSGSVMDIPEYVEMAAAISR